MPIVDTTVPITSARCDEAMKICLEQPPEEQTINENHKAACWMNVKRQLEAEGGAHE